MNTANLFACFGDVIELDLPSWDVIKIQEVLNSHTEWKQYNPRKGVNRYGLSVTSLDGGYSGVPDLDSILEFNKLNNTKYIETDFNVKTDVVSQILNLDELLNSLSPGLGRCHFLKLNAGGFFPPHRDNGTAVPSSTFRMIVPLGNTRKNDWHWIHEGKVLSLTSGRTYCINTTKEHSVFSFKDNCCMLVFNVMATLKNIHFITSHLDTK